MNKNSGYSFGSIVTRVFRGILKYFMCFWWLALGLLMVYMNDFNWDTLGWIYILGSPVWAPQ